MRRYFLAVILNLLVVSGIAQDNYFDGLNRFAFRIFKQEFRQNMNFIFSPLLLEGNFIPMYLASRGFTHMQVEYEFGFPADYSQFKADAKMLGKILYSNNNFSTRVESFMGVFLEDSLRSKVRKSFMQANDSLNLDTIVFVDMTRTGREVQDSLNRFIRHSKIQLLPKPLFGLSRLRGGILLASSAFFSGNWERNFTAIYRAPFYLDKYGRKTKYIDYLTVSGYFKFVDGPDYQVIEIPYENNQLSLMIILPHGNYNLSELEQKINYDDYTLVTGGLSLQRLRLFLPILSLKSKFDFKNVIAKDIPNVFKPGANFTQMVRKLVWIDGVYQSVEFKIRPEQMIPLRRYFDFQQEAQLNRIIFINHPFIFLIRDNLTNVILFMGCIYKPV